MKTLKEFKDLQEGTNLASFQNATPEGKTATLTEYSLGKDKGHGIQITAGAKNFVQLNQKGAKNLGKMLIKWADTQF